MNFAIDKILKIVNLLGANGAGPSSSSNKNPSGSWLTEVLAWVGDAIVKLATVVWGWLINIFYVVVRFCLNLIDIFQMFVEKLVGIEVYNQEGGLGAVESLAETDLIIRFITNETIKKVFTTIMILGLLLLIIFSIIALIKQNYTAATTDGGDGVKNPKEVLKNAGKAIFMCLLVPFLLIFGILGSNAVLASICNSIRGDNDLTIGGLVFTASAYEANKFREYASDGLRVPITLTQATEVVNPGNYSSVEDMQVLFFKLAKGDVYISAISDDVWFLNNASNYAIWTDALSAEDVQIDASKLMGNVAFQAFSEDFDAFYSKYFLDEDGFGPFPLAEHNMLNPIVKSVYVSNWINNKKYTNLTYDYSSTYQTQREVEFGSIDGESQIASIIVNTSSYTGHENFATIELEYYVMADLIDYAVEQDQTFYYVNANSNRILWSNIILDPDEPEETITIEEYNNQFMIAKSEADTGPVYQGLAYTSEITDLQKFAEENYGSGVKAVADSAFMVRYFNGVNRLYWSENGSAGESEGSTYIICTKSGDNYIPVTQTTTKFNSSFLADDYGGPIVARGIFKSENLIPKDYCLPTEIMEQVVDDYGNELVGMDKTSPFALSDSYTKSSNFASVMGEFTGKLFDLTGGVATELLEDLFNGVGSEIDKWKERLQNDTMNTLNEDDLFSKDEADAYNLAHNLKDGDEGLKKEGDRKGNLLLNTNIDGFTYTTKDGKPNAVTFYDKNGRKITAGASYKDATQTEFNLTDESKFNKTAYVLIQKDMLGDVVIPWYFTDALNLSAMGAIIMNAEMSDREYTFLLAEYTYDNIQISLPRTGVSAETGLDTDTFRMLLNFNITQIYEVNKSTDFNNIKGATSGEFIVTDQYGVGTGGRFHIEKKVNLVVSGGEIYYSNGTKFFGREDVSKLYTNFFSNYINSNLSKSVIDYFSVDNAEKSYTTVLEKINNIKAFKDFNTDCADEIDAINEKYGNELTDEEMKQKVAELEALRTAYEAEREDAIVSGFMASDFRAGAASFIKEYNKAYYTVDEVVKVNADGNEEIEGTIKFYNKNNQEMEHETLNYTSKKFVEGQSITQRVVIVGGANNVINPSFFSIVNADTTSYKANIKWEGGDGFDEKLAKLLETVGSINEEIVNERQTWFYDVTYNFSYWEYLDKDNKTVAILGLNMDSIDIASLYEDGIGNNDSTSYLKVKNNSVYANSLGKYVLTTSGVKNYISSMAENTKAYNDGQGIKCEFSAPSDTEVGAKDVLAYASTSYNLLTSEMLNVKSQAEYDNIYIYFLRGDLNWTMLFDFCINLPTISWSPFNVRFVFRFNMGTSYNYLEEVIYRLQGGQFYLDYNFRSSTGIGMANLYRMSSINPFILVFSTVLILSILWGVIWGLIRRIYDIVLLFIMLPAVCSTMPLDQGGRFGKWKDELIDQVFRAYSVLITLNLYFVLVPIIKDVTSDLITAGDLPSTITGMFSSITAGAHSLIGNIGLVGGKFSNMISNIGFNSFLLDAELTTAEMSILGHVNSIVYIMFFLVLTTMLKNGKALIETILKIGKLEGGVDKEAIDGNIKTLKDTAKKVKSSALGRTVGAVAHGAGNLARGGIKLGAKGFRSLISSKMAGGAPGDSMATGSVGGTATPPPSLADGTPSSVTTDDSAVDVTVDGTATGTGPSLTGDPISVPPGSFDDSDEAVKVGGTADAVGSRKFKMETSEGVIDAEILHATGTAVEVSGKTDEEPSFNKATNTLGSGAIESPSIAGELPSGTPEPPTDEAFKQFTQSHSLQEIKGFIDGIESIPESERDEETKQAYKQMTQYVESRISELNKLYDGNTSRMSSFISGEENSDVASKSMEDLRSESTGNVANDINLQQKRAYEDTKFVKDSLSKEKTESVTTAENTMKAEDVKTAQKAENVTTAEKTSDAKKVEKAEKVETAKTTETSIKTEKSSIAPEEELDGLQTEPNDGKKKKVKDTIKESATKVGSTIKAGAEKVGDATKKVATTTKKVAGVVKSGATKAGKVAVKVGKGVAKGAKVVATTAAIGAAAVVVPAPVTIAVAGGVLIAKGGKKIKEGLSKHPKVKEGLKTFAKGAAIAGFTPPPVAATVGVVAGAKFVAKKVNEKKARASTPSSTTASVTPPPSDKSSATPGGSAPKPKTPSSGATPSSTSGGDTPSTKSTPTPKSSVSSTASASATKTSTGPRVNISNTNSGGRSSTTVSTDGSSVNITNTNQSGNASTTRSSSNGSNSSSTQRTASSSNGSSSQRTVTGSAGSASSAPSSSDPKIKELETKLNMVGATLMATLHRLDHMKPPAGGPPTPEMRRELDEIKSQLKLEQERHRHVTAQMRDEHKQQVTKLQSQIDSLQKDLTKKTGNARMDAEQQILKLQKQMTDLNTQNKSLERKLEDTEIQLSRASANLKTLERKVGTTNKYVNKSGGTPSAVNLTSEYEGGKGQDSVKRGAEGIANHRQQPQSSPTQPPQGGTPNGNK